MTESEAAIIAALDAAILEIKQAKKGMQNEQKSHGNSKDT